MTSILLKNVPEEDVSEFQKRAQQSGRTLVEELHYLLFPDDNQETQSADTHKVSNSESLGALILRIAQLRQELMDSN